MMNVWKIVIDKYPTWELKAGKPRYSVIDSFRNVACVTDNQDYARGWCDALNLRTN